MQVLSLFDLNPCKFGSMEEYALSLSSALRRRGWESTLIFSDSPPDFMSRRFQESGARFGTYTSGTRFAAYASMFRILRRHRAEVVHVHFLEYFSLLPILVWLARPKVMIFTDHYRQPQPIGNITRLACWLWDRILFRLFGTRIVAVSSHIKETLVACYKMDPRRIQVIPNGVNPGRFVPTDGREKEALRSALEIPAGAAVIVCASNLRPEKGIADLLTAAPEVLARCPSAHFIILGEGPEGTGLRQQAVELRIESRVRFTGLRSDVDKFMAAADIVITPSVWQEPAGLVVIEGMAAGRPVVATRVGGIPEYLEDGVSGILVEPKAPQALASALVALLDDPDRAAAMGNAGRNRIQATFTMEHWVASTLALYDESLAAR